MTIDIEKAKQVLAALQREKQDQDERLQRAKEAKKQFKAKYGYTSYNN